MLCSFDEVVVVDGVIAKKGNWFNLGENRLGNGRKQTIICLESNIPMLEELEVEILDKIEAERNPVVISQGFDGEDT